MDWLQGNSLITLSIAIGAASLAVGHIRGLLAMLLSLFTSHVTVIEFTQRMIVRKWLSENAWFITRTPTLDDTDYDHAVAVVWRGWRTVLIRIYYRRNAGYLSDREDNFDMYALSDSALTGLWTECRDWFWRNHIITQCTIVSKKNGTQTGRHEIGELRQFDRPDEIRYVESVRTIINNHRERYSTYGDDRRIGVLLVGPPDSGKTTTMRVFVSLLRRPAHVIDALAADSCYVAPNTVICVEDVERLLEATEKQAARNSAYENFIRMLEQVDSLQRGARGDAIILSSTDPNFADTIRENAALCRRYMIVNVARPNLTPELTFELCGG
jgi:hypothetical protein